MSVDSQEAEEEDEEEGGEKEKKGKITPNYSKVSCHEVKQLKKKRYTYKFIFIRTWTHNSKYFDTHIYNNSKVSFELFSLCLCVLHH